MRVKVLLITPPVLVLLMVALLAWGSQAQPSPPVVVETISATMVTAISAAALLIISAIVAGAVQIIGALKGLRTDTGRVGAEITSKLAEVHNSQNGANTALLERVEALTKTIAVITGQARDLREADAASKVAEAKRVLTVEEGVKREAAKGTEPGK